MVIAQCKAGIIGSFPALNARPQHVLEEWIIRIKTELAEYQEQNPDKKVSKFSNILDGLPIRKRETDPQNFLQRTSNPRVLGCSFTKEFENEM